MKKIDGWFALLEQYMRIAKYDWKPVRNKANEFYGKHPRTSPQVVAGAFFHIYLPIVSKHEPFRAWRSLKEISTALGIPISSLARMTTRVRTQSR